MFSLDISLFNFLFNLGQKLGANWFFIFFATYLPYLIVAAFLSLIYKEKNAKRRIYLLGFSILGLILSRGIVTEVIRYVFPYVRPFLSLNLNPMLVDTASSFPSGHMTFLFVIVFSAFLMSKKWGWILAGASLATGISRIIAGVHWPSDIVGGIIVAGAVFALLYYLVLPPKKIIPPVENKEEIQIQNV